MKINKDQLFQKHDAKLWFLCTALLLNEIYLPFKFHVDALHSFKMMLKTKKGRVDYYMPPFGGIKIYIDGIR